MSDPKPLFFIHDHETKVLEFDVFGKQPVGSYDEVNAAFVSATEHLYAAAEAVFDGDETAFVASLERAQDQLTIVADLLDDAAGVDLLDRPSGWAMIGATTGTPAT